MLENREIQPSSTDIIVVRVSFKDGKVEKEADRSSYTLVCQMP